MASWKYILVVALVLIGTTAGFGYWALQEFQITFKVMDNSYAELSAVTAATLNKLVVQDQAGTSSPIINFTFPSQGEVLLGSCDYRLTWTSSSTISSINLSLIDAGTSKALGPVTSGLGGTTTGKQLKEKSWTVGQVWPGNYYLQVLSLNDQEVSQKSDVFIIEEAPTSTTACPLSQ